MTTIKAHFDGKAFIPDQPVDFPINHPATILLEQPVGSPVPLSDEEFERALAEMNRDLVSADHLVDWSRDSIYSGTIDDTR